MKYQVEATKVQKWAIFVHKYYILRRKGCDYAQHPGFKNKQLPE